MERDINLCKFKGNLTRKPELKGTDKKYALLSVACNRGYQNQDGKFEADFITFKLWKDPEKIVETLNTGDKVEIESHYKTRSYVEDGKTIYTSDFVIDKLDYTLKKEKESEKEKTEELEK